MSIHVNFGGRYRLQVFHGNTDILKYDTGWFSNIITDNGLNLLGTGWSGGGCYVGTNGAPGAAGDTVITNPVGVGMAELSWGIEVATLPYYGWRRYTATFAIGAIVGTIAEVGVGISATDLFSRAQLLDVNGAPVTLTLGGIDRLTITYELRQYFDVSDQAFSVTIDGAATSGTRRALIENIHTSNSMCPTLGRPAVVRAGGDALSYFYTSGTSPFIGGDIFTRPSGTAVVANYYAVEPYVPGVYTNKAVVGITAGQGIVTNITAVAVSVYNRWEGGTRLVNGGDWQFSLDPPISKTQYEDLRLTFETSWGRA